ncbi:MAG: NAD(P)/FAD-dependent oxidoreductase [bacterium]|nr:NAD(P)/FAD-dependent oxidoreductase [bacterium]
MSVWDAVIVGGGPAGSTVAWQLARKGLRPLVLDAAKFPRVKLCAGWVTKKVMKDLELTIETYPRTIQPFEAVYVGYDDTLHETRWREPASFGIVRQEFDDFLLRRAERAGAEVREGVRVREVKIGADSVLLDIGEAESVEGAVVVGAGGHTCPVARSLSGVPDEEVVVLTQESETRVGADVLRSLAPHYGLPELFAEPDFKGYGWYFTKGDFLNIGVGCVGKSPSVHERREALLARLRKSERLPEGLKLTPFKGHAYTIRRGAPRRAAGERYLLVGDACGLAQDFSGEGIGPGVRSACMAAEAILAFRERGVGFDEYARRVSETFGSGEKGIAGRLAERLPDRLVQSVAKMMCGNAWLRRRLVLEGAFGIG